MCSVRVFKQTLEGHWNNTSPPKPFSSQLNTTSFLSCCTLKSKVSPIHSRVASFLALTENESSFPLDCSSIQVAPAICNLCSSHQRCNYFHPGDGKMRHNLSHSQTCSQTFFVKHKDNQRHLTMLDSFANVYWFIAQFRALTLSERIFQVR